MNARNLPARVRLSPRADARRRARGFTLIELMVALSGGLIFTLFVFMLARDATRFYQNESRVADATFGSIAGFQRLRTDIARAGYLATPNIQTDNRFCGNAAANAALGGLQSLASLQIGSSPTHFSFGKNSVSPDSITLMGSYASAEQFPVRLIVPLPNNTFEVHFQTGTPAMLRMGYGASTKGFTDLFLPGRVLRIVDKTGREQYGYITARNAGNTAQPFVTLSTTPAIVWKTSANNCGLRGTEFGSLVNVVQMIRYEVRSLSGVAQFAELSPATSDAPGEAATDRTELVREELQIANPAATVANTAPELVAEFAVDLKFGLTVLDNVVNRTTKIRTAAADIAPYATDVTQGVTTGFGPGQIRAVRARLSVRSRTPDRRDANIDATAAGGIYRFDVSKNGVSTPNYARVRTLQADIALRNQPNAN